MGSEDDRNKKRDSQEEEDSEDEKMQEFIRIMRRLSNSGTGRRDSFIENARFLQRLDQSQAFNKNKRVFRKDVHPSQVMRGRYIPPPDYSSYSTPTIFPKKTRNLDQIRRSSENLRKSQSSLPRIRYRDPKDYRIDRIKRSKRILSNRKRDINFENRLKRINEKRRQWKGMEDRKQYFRSQYQLQDIGNEKVKELMRWRRFWARKEEERPGFIPYIIPVVPEIKPGLKTIREQTDSGRESMSTDGESDTDYYSSGSDSDYYLSDEESDISESARGSGQAGYDSRPHSRFQMHEESDEPDSEVDTQIPSTSTGRGRGRQGGWFRPNYQEESDDEFDD